jgi:hypothetical protein
MSVVSVVSGMSVVSVVSVMGKAFRGKGRKYTIDFRDLFRLFLRRCFGVDCVLCCAVLCCVGWCAMDLRRAVLVSQKEATHGGTVMGRGVITVNCMSWHDNFLLYNLFNYKTRHNNNQHKRVLLTLMVADGGAVAVCDMQCLRADKWEVCNDR